MFRAGINTFNLTNEDRIEYEIWKLKKAIRVQSQTYNELNLEKDPDKTLIGRTGRGFEIISGIS